jgi:hypothetical protein
LKEISRHVNDLRKVEEEIRPFFMSFLCEKSSVPCLSCLPKIMMIIVIMRWNYVHRFPGWWKNSSILMITNEIWLEILNFLGSIWKKKKISVYSFVRRLLDPLNTLIRQCHELNVYACKWPFGYFNFILLLLHCIV